MGRFKCVQCHCTYHSKRFFWEEDCASESEESDDSDNEIQASNYTSVKWSLEVSKNEVAKLGIKTRRASDGLLIVSVEDIGAVSTWNQTNPSSAVCVGDKIVSVNDVMDDPWAMVDELRLDGTLQLGVCRVFALDVYHEVTDLTDDNPGLTKLDGKKMARRADVVRASGTAANLMGTAAPILHYALAPVSAVGGAVGAVSGAVQLREGLSTPSGIVDPHLVTKGAVTASVGTTCMALGVGAAIAPGLLAAALCLGVAGFGAATVVDATMDGLCDRCREDRTRSASKSSDIEQEHVSESSRVTTSQVQDDLGMDSSESSPSPLLRLDEQ